MADGDAPPMALADGGYVRRQLPYRRNHICAAAREYKPSRMDCVVGYVTQNVSVVLCALTFHATYFSNEQYWEHLPSGSRTAVSTVALLVAFTLSARVGELCAVIATEYIFPHVPHFVEGTEPESILSYLPFHHSLSWRYALPSALVALALFCMPPVQFLLTSTHTPQEHAPWGQFVVKTIILHQLAEVQFYTLHRLQHLIRCLRPSHKRHHQPKVNRPWVGLHKDPLEMIPDFIFTMIPTMANIHFVFPHCWLVSMSPWQMCLGYSMGLWKGLVEHTGKPLSCASAVPWLGELSVLLGYVSSLEIMRAHELHHHFEMAANGVNFSPVWMDKLMGTYLDDFDSPTQQPQPKVPITNRE